MNVLFNTAKDKILGGTVLLASDTIKVVLIDISLYTFSNAHEFLSQIPGGARVGTSDALTGKTVVSGVFNASPGFVAVTSVGQIVSALAFYKDTGSDASSPLILFLDVGAGLPFTTTGAAVVLNWATGASKIFALSAFGGPNWRVDTSNNLQVKHNSANTWHTIQIAGSEGGLTLSIGAGQT